MALVLRSLHDPLRFFEEEERWLLTGLRQVLCARRSSTCRLTRMRVGGRCFLICIEPSRTHREPGTIPGEVQPDSGRRQIIPAPPSRPQAVGRLSHNNEEDDMGPINQSTPNRYPS